MKILLIGGLTHLGFNALRMFNDIFPGVQTDVFDDTTYAKRVFNTYQKIAFINTQLPNATLLEGDFSENKVHEGGYTHIFDFSFPAKATFNHVYESYNHEEILYVIRRLERIVNILPNANVCVIAHHSLYETLDFAWSLRENQSNIREHVSESTSDTRCQYWKNRLYKNARIYITPDCVGGVDPEGSIQFSMERCLESGDNLLVTPAYYRMPVVASGTDDVLYTIFTDVMTNSASRCGGNVIWCQPSDFINLSDIGVYLVTALNRAIGTDKFDIVHLEGKDATYENCRLEGLATYTKQVLPEPYFTLLSKRDRTINVTGLHVSHYFVPLASSAVLIHQNTP